MLKVSIFFNQTIGDETHPDACGFSETWYRDSSITDAIEEIQLLAMRRARMLTNNATIVGARFQNIGGASQTIKMRYVGTVVRDGDLPQVALNVRLIGQNNDYKKMMQLRGIPDGRVEFGEYRPSRDFAAAFDGWVTALATNGWRFQARKKSTPRVKIFSIDSLGNFVIAPGATYAVNDQVILRNVRNANGNGVSGTFYVEARTNDQNGKLRGWTGGTVGESGTFAKLEFEYMQVARGGILNATTRKVGRPFTQFRGRAVR